MRAIRTMLVTTILVAGMVSCGNHQSESFQLWHEQQSFTYIESGDNSNTRHYERVKSTPLLIDTIYRSMQGPLSSRAIYIDEGRDDLIWLTGYNVQIRDEQTGGVLPDGFLCHNNLNIANKSQFPWKVKTRGTSIRLVTLTEGQLAVNFPDGFGVPISGSQSLKIASQVLNHNIPDINLKVFHDVEIEYLRQSQLTGPLIPLFQQSVSILKQESGPPGEYGTGPDCALHVVDTNGISNAPESHTCEISFDQENFNPYADKYGRTFSAHWVIPMGKQVLRTNVTPILNLSFDTKIHYIGVHLHPFAKTLELRDATLDSLLFTAYVKDAAGRIGIEQIDHYSSEEGIAVYKDHAYELISTYECTDSVNTHTAMAVMYLYLHDKQ